MKLRYLIDASDALDTQAAVSRLIKRYYSKWRKHSCYTFLCSTFQWTTPVVFFSGKPTRQSFVEIYLLSVLMMLTFHPVFPTAVGSTSLFRPRHMCIVCLSLLFCFPHLHPTGCGHGVQPCVSCVWSWLTLSGVSHSQQVWPLEEHEVDICGWTNAQTWQAVVLKDGRRGSCEHVWVQLLKGTDSSFNLSALLCCVYCTLLDGCCWCNLWDASKRPMAAAIVERLWLSCEARHISRTFCIYFI